MPSHRSQRSSLDIEEWDGNIQELPCIGNGVSGLIFAINEERVAKIGLGTPQSIEDIETERRAYRRLGRFARKVGYSESQYILTCLEIDNPRGLVFQRCRDTVRRRLQTTDPTAEQRLKWAIQAAKGLGFAHDCQIIQGDVGCHNMLLDFNDDIKIADFAGSSIRGSQATVNYEVRSRLPSTPNPTKKSDIFAFGSAMYELATGRVPYEGFSYRAVQTLYKRKEFPKDVDGIQYVGKIIRRCWNQKYEDFWEVIDDLCDIRLKQTPMTPRTETRQIPATRCAYYTSPQSVSGYTSVEPSSGSLGTETSYVHYPRRHTHHQGRKTSVSSQGSGRSQRDEGSWLGRLVTWPWHIGGKA